MADLNPVKGHEQAGFRPVLVLQNDILNANLNTVVIAPITKNLRARGYFTTYFLDKKKMRLKYDSIALLYQVRTIDKIRLQRRVASISYDDRKALKEQLLLVF